ncbi:MAG: hypothetical protein MUF38_16600 [Anaerolineae bacterium]|jgi:hypothetical protein|nr:hypothetical protein [Anaerolineae bacterium]
MTTNFNGYQVEFSDNDIVFSNFITLQVEGRAEYQDGEWLLLRGPKQKDVGYAETLQDVMEWAKNGFEAVE